MKKKIFAIGSAVIILALAAFIYFKFYFVFGEGVKTGDLNFVVYKGYVFKTYEGRIIQAGFKSAPKGSSATVSVQSYEFDFSVEDKSIADTLILCGGKSVQLHYKEYLGALPWRGQQKYVVDGIIAIE